MTARKDNRPKDWVSPAACGAAGELMVAADLIDRGFDVCRKKAVKIKQSA
jgi:hypothetical protein